MAKTDEELLAVVDAATAVAPGAWEHDTEENEGAYGAGPGARHGFKSYVMFDGQGRRIFDGSNTEIAAVEEEYDEDGTHAWDESGRRVFEFIATFDPPQVRALILRAQAAEARVEALLADHARLVGEVEGSSRGSGQHLCGSRDEASVGATAALAKEPTAWRYEFSVPRQEDGFRDGSLAWHVGYSATPPSFEVHNLTPLYARLSGDDHA